MSRAPFCSDCGAECCPNGIAAGYALTKAGQILCYDCCARIEEDWMREHGRITLYLVDEDGRPPEVTNWPGTLRFKVDKLRQGRHNLAGHRTDVWFRDQDGQEWWGANYGSWSQLLHCRRKNGRR